MAPSYLSLSSEELVRRVETALERSSPCTLCPRQCGAMRRSGEKGECGIGNEAVVSTSEPHFGEESVLSGWQGSGTVFFSGCNLRCVYCQNYDISQSVSGRAVDRDSLAAIFLRIQDLGCHNLNLVTPSHTVPPILKALQVAIEGGFELPIVYNTSAYDTVETLRLFEGIVDIYMPDLKYGRNAEAKQYSLVEDYFETAMAALLEMHRQTGDLVIEHGLATRGLLIRHLVLPGDIATTDSVMRYIAEELSRDSWVNVMDQYRPAFHAHGYNELSRGISSDEHRHAVRTAKAYGIHRGIPFD